MTFKEYFSKSKHTRKENAWFNREMKKKYEKYKKVYHEAKIEYRKYTADKYTFKEFKEAYEYAYKTSDGKGTLKQFLKKEEFATLSEHSYEVKRMNLKTNQEKLRLKVEAGYTLNKDELDVLSVDPNGDIHKIVNYFDKLGLAHLAFDSI